MRLDSLQCVEREAVVPRSKALEVRERDTGNAGVDGWTPPPTFHIICLFSAKSTRFFYLLPSVVRAVLQPSLHLKRKRTWKWIEKREAFPSVSHGKPLGLLRRWRRKPGQYSSLFQHPERLCPWEPGHSFTWVSDVCL